MNNRKYVDFHTHTLCSDGHYTTEELIKEAISKGIKVLAITDHNYIHDDLAQLQSKYKDIELINGCEISTSYTTEKGEKIEVHIIALGFDENNENLRKLTASNHTDKRAYIEKIREKLKENCNIDIPSYDELTALYPTKHIGRMQIADYLVKKGYANDIDEALDEYIGTYGKRQAFVNALDFCSYVDFDTAIRAVQDAGGVPVLAHLFSYGLEMGECFGLFKQFYNACDKKGGLEVYYLKYSNELIEILENLAEQSGIYISTASDFHGRDKDSLNDRVCKVDENHVYNLIKNTRKT